MLRTALLGALAACVLTWSWLRLEVKDGAAEVLIWSLAAGVLPALPRSWRLRAAAVAVAAIVVVREMLGSAWPRQALDRFDEGFRPFFDVALPFVPVFHPKMHALVVLASVGFTLAVSLAIAARRPLLAAGLLVAGAGWPTTLLPGSRPLVAGAVLLGAALAVIAGLSPAVRLREAALAGGVAAAAAVALASVPAVAKGGFLAWEKWDPYTSLERQVSVTYVWDTSYRPLTWPKKKTVVFRAQAAPVSRYWRATTLDVYSGESWIEYPHPLHRDPPFSLLLPGAALNPQRQQRAVIEVEGLQDTHLVGASVPVDFDTDFENVRYQETGTAFVFDGTPRGSKYTAISYLPRVSPERLAASRPVYGPQHERYREVQSRWQTPLPASFGAVGRDEKMAAFFRREQLQRVYRPLYRQAQQVVGATTSPYIAAVRLEDWFRSGGGFRYDESPPEPDGMPTLVHFVTRSKRGYCQHFASSMALMLRYLGIPARVAAGFTSGSYNQDTRQWTVTDHDAHTWVEVWFRRFGWLPFDPTPGRGTLDGAYSAASTRFNPGIVAALGAGLDPADIKLRDGGLDRVGPSGRDSARDVPGDVPTTARDEPSLLRLLLLLALGALAVVTVAKQAVRGIRFLTRDPRRAAAACRRELADFLADQRFVVPPSATVAELGEIARHELGVNPEPFVTAVETARYGPPARAGVSARVARRELRRLRREIRRRLSRVERARGLVSLRSLGVS